MAEFDELVQALTWLVTNRIQQKMDYTHGLLGDGNGRVRVSTIPGSPEVDYVFFRPDRFSNRSFKVFNKRIEGQDGDPVIVGELPWEPDLVQVVDMDWAAYADVGWGDDVTTTNRHGSAHQWRDGAPGIDTFNVYRRQFGDLKTYPAVSGTLAVGVSPYSMDLFGTQHQWPGIQDFSLSGALPTVTGTARMALVFWSPASGTSGFLGVASGTLGSSAEATILNRPITPAGTIPSAFVKLSAGQSSVSEFDIWDAREPFRPGLSFGTGSFALSADMIPISDVVGFYTGSTVESALMESPYRLTSPDGAINPAVVVNNSGEVGIGTATPAFNLIIIDDSGETTVRVQGASGADNDATLDLTGRGSDGTFNNVEISSLGSTTDGGIMVFSTDDSGVLLTERMRLDRDGRLGIGTTDAERTLDVRSTSVPSQWQRSSNDIGGAGAFYRKSRGTLATPLIVQADDFVFGFEGRGFDGTDFETVANVTGEIDGTPGNNDMPGRLTFFTTPDGAKVAQRRMTIKESGNVGIGTLLPEGVFHTYESVSGFLNWEFDGLDSTVRTIVSNGTGDVLYRLTTMYVLRDSAAAVASGTTDVSNSASVNLTVGTNTVRLRVNADGSCDIARTAGSDTIKVALSLRWL